MSNSIEKHIDLAASQSRVWRALTDYKEFGTWFRVRLEKPFVAGQATSGYLTYPGYEHLRLEVKVRDIEPETKFSFHWHPYAVNPAKDYSVEEPTLVEFTLSKSTKGTLLRVVESGFDKIPADRRAEAFRMNEGGWAGQMENIAHYLEV